MRRTLFIARSVELLVLGAMMFLLPISPLTCTVISGQVRYLRNYRATLTLTACYARASWRTRVISRNLQRTLHGPIAPPETIEGHCTHCGLCCVDKSCVFLDWTDEGASRCAIYNNWFWKMTSCGRYPVDRESIAVYGCPSFKAIAIKTMSC